MMMLDGFVPLLLFCISSSATPGPNNIMMMSSGLTHGVRQSLGHYFGICIGFPLMVLAVGAGLSQLFILFPFLENVVKYAGIIYMLYLAWKIATSTADLNEVKKSKPLTFFQAVAFQWINPKAWIMAVGAISTFSTLFPSHLLEVLSLAIIFFVIGIPCVGAWLVFGSLLKNILKDLRTQKIFNRTMAALLVASIALLFV